LLGWFGLTVPRAQSDAESLVRARQRFEHGVGTAGDVVAARRLFAEAADDLRRLHERGEASPALYLALGNAEALAGRWPRALWAFHAGRRLDPNDRALREHLQYARSLVQYPSGGRGRPAPDAWPSWLYQPNMTELLLIAAGTWALAWFAGAWWYVRRGSRPLALTGCLGAIAVAAGAGYWVDERQAEDDRARPLAIVMADETPLHRGNGPSYPLNADVPSLPAGLEVRVQHLRGAWTRVRLTTGETGWVPGEKLLTVPAR
jgi:hypothetical protein